MNIVLNSERHERVHTEKDVLITSTCFSHACLSPPFPAAGLHSGDPVSSFSGVPQVTLSTGKHIYSPYPTLESTLYVHGPLPCFFPSNLILEVYCYGIRVYLILSNDSYHCLSWMWNLFVLFKFFGCPERHVGS